MKRRDFLKTTAAAVATATIGTKAENADGAQPADRPAKLFRVWAIGCAHVGTDLRRGGRESLADAIRHSEEGGKEGGPPFEWDIAVHLGDLSGTQGSPGDEEGELVVRQFGAAKKHAREQFYNLAGNHDATGTGEPTQWWFRKWVDPTGESTKNSGVDPKNRPFPIEGTWERYSLRAGNLLFLMMCDRNDGPRPVGRGKFARGKGGGYPAGAVTGETFRWWQEAVEANQDSVIVSAHHHMLKQTTFASGPYEGFRKGADGKWRSHYHGYFPDGAPEGASYLYFVDGEPDAQAYESYLADNEGAIDLWLGGHTHSHPDDKFGGRAHVERKWGVNFVNCAALTRYHTRIRCPMSRLFTFTEGSAKARVQCYLHTADHAPQGWYAPAEGTIELGKPFRMG